MKQPWLKNGLLNIYEQSFTRVADAVFSLALVATFPPAEFSKLALAQAAVAPLLVLFISPDSIMYREFSTWREKGHYFVMANLRGFRFIAWGKALAAVVVASLVALRGEDYWISFSALIWAFALALMPQIAGPDREFLRLNLKLGELNLLTLFQKSFMLTGLFVVVQFFDKSIPLLAALSAVAVVSNSWLAKLSADRFLHSQGAGKAGLAAQNGPSVKHLLIDSVKRYSFWNHVSGIILLWVQTMDLFFLGLMKFPATDVGLYAFVLKISNMALTMPTAIASNFLLWLGRRTSSREGMEDEWLRQRKFSSILAIGVALTCWAIAYLAPSLLTLLARGRWSGTDQAVMATWMRQILAGAFFYASALPLAMWLQVRAPSFDLFKRVYLPWLMFSAAAYYGGISRWGFTGAAKMNIFVGIAYAVLLGLFVYRLRTNFSNPKVEISAGIQ
jgi:hypothetical protein